MCVESKGRYKIVAQFISNFAVSVIFPFLPDFYFDQKSVFIVDESFSLPDMSVSAFSIKPYLSIIIVKDAVWRIRARPRDNHCRVGLKRFCRSVYDRWIYTIELLARFESSSLMHNYFLEVTIFVVTICRINNNSILDGHLIFKLSFWIIQ
jgi:hypothetical protein